MNLCTLGSVIVRIHWNDVWYVFPGEHTIHRYLNIIWSSRFYNIQLLIYTELTRLMRL